MRYATLGGARALGLEGDIGAIRAGMKADLVLLDLHSTSFTPLNSAARQMVFTESGSSVDTVLIDGRIVMQDRKLTTIDEDALRAAVEDVMPGLRRDIEMVAARNADIAPFLLAAYRKTWDDDVGMNRYLERNQLS
jgi:adenine deaminase